MFRPATALRLAGAALVLTMATACSSDSDTTAPTDSSVVVEPTAAETTTAPTTAAPTTAPATTDAPTTTAAPAPESFLGRGPYAVGVTTLELGDRPTEVWYPVDPDAVAGQPTEIFDALSVFPESLQSLIPDELSGTVDTGAVRGATPSTAGPFPVVVYSHGFGGYRQVATAHTTQLASWGFVVASTDHLERGIAAQATGQLRSVPGQDVRDVDATLDALGSGELAAIVDLEHVGITGHSAGAGTSARAALELDRIDAFASVSGGAPVVVTGDDIGTTAARLVGAAGPYELTVVAVTEADATISVDGGEPQVVLSSDLTVATADGSITLVLPTDGVLQPGTITVERVAAAKPALVVYAEFDAVVVPEASTTLYETLAAPKWMVGIADAGHNSFTDSCAGIRELGGLSALTALLGEAQVARAEDGCLADNVDPALAIDLWGHYSVAFFRTALGVEDDAASLGIDISDELGGIELVALDADA